MLIRNRRPAACPRDLGFTLFELLITLFIISLLAIFSFPSFSNLFQKNTADALSAELLSAIQFARQEAITRGEKIILCKSDNKKICSGEWRDGFIVKSSDEVLQIFQPTNMEGDLFWRAKLGMTDLEFFPDGFSKDENGTFWYCEKNAENPVWAIALNQLARARKILPNKDGEILDGKGERLSC
jgi:type IV fimbrial biogenesis protein FimT